MAELCHHILKDNKYISDETVDISCVASVEKWVSNLAVMVGVSGWESNVNFLQNGGDSFQLVRITNLIEDGLGSGINVRSLATTNYAHNYSNIIMQCTCTHTVTYKMFM